MSKDLSRIHTKLLKTIQVNFSKPVEIEAIVDIVDYENNAFTIQTEDRDKILECRTQDNISQLKHGDKICIKGRIRLHPNNTGKVFITVEYFYHVSDKEKYAEALDLYNKLSNMLQSEKCKVIIEKISTVEIPKVVCNLALIVLPDNEHNIENFKISFQERCSGNLFIYRLKNRNMESGLQTAFDYFKKYHNIDMICLLINQITLANAYQLSSKSNVKYIINRKKCPFTISIISNSVPEPLVASLSNKKVVGINHCIDFIHSIQSSFRVQLNNGIEKGTNIMKKILEKNTKSLNNLKMCITEMIDPKIFNKSDDPFDKLKDLLIKRLNKEILILHKIQIVSMKYLIHDTRFRKFTEKLIESEKDQLMKKMALQQNKTQSMDDIILEMAKHSEDKKIENKTSDNILIDSMHNNINYDGEF